MGRERAIARSSSFDASDEPPLMNPLVRWFHQLGSPPYFDRFAARWAPWAYLSGLLLMAVGVSMTAEEAGDMDGFLSNPVAG